MLLLSHSEHFSEGCFWVRTQGQTQPWLCFFKTLSSKQRLKLFSFVSSPFVASCFISYKENETLTCSLMLAVVSPLWGATAQTSPEARGWQGHLKRGSFLGMWCRGFCKHLFFYPLFLLCAEQNQSDCSRGDGGPERSDGWLGVKGEIQQKECFRGVCLFVVDKGNKAALLIWGKYSCNTCL